MGAIWEMIVSAFLWWTCHKSQVISLIGLCNWDIFNTLRPRQNGRRFAADTFKRIFLNENFRISIKISLKFVPKGPINNIPALVQIMAWRRSGGKPLSEPMMVSLLTHICVTRPQWVNASQHHINGLMQERHNSIANPLELYLSCTNPSTWAWWCKSLGIWTVCSTLRVLFRLLNRENTKAVLYWILCVGNPWVTGPHTMGQ